MTSDRPYRRAVSQEAALGLLERTPAKRSIPRSSRHFAAAPPVLTRRRMDEPSDATVDRWQAPGSAGEAVADRRTVDAFAEIALANRESYTLYEIAHAMGRSMSLGETMTLISSKLSDLVPFSAVRSVPARATTRRFDAGSRRACMPSCSRTRDRDGCRPERLGRTAPARRWSTASRARSSRRRAPAGQPELESALVCPLIVERRGDRHHRRLSRQRRLPTRRITAACSS